MELTNVLQILWRRKWIIIATVAIASIVVVGLVMQMPNRYSTEVTLRVLTPTSGGWGNTTYGDRLSNTYLHVIQSDRVMVPLMEELDLERRPNVSLNALRNTELLVLTVEGRNPEIANTLADMLIENNRELYFGQVGESSGSVMSELDVAIEELNALYEQYNLTGDNAILRGRLPLEEQLLLENAERRVQGLQDTFNTTIFEEERQATSIYVVQYAEAPGSPDGPNRILFIGLGVAIAGVAALGLAFVFENLDSRLYTSEQIRDVVGALPLAHIPMASELRHQVKADKNTIALENFRTLRTNLFVMLGLAEESRSIVVTSADPKEGKSTVAAFLAAVTAQVGNSVVVVDGDMRVSRQHDLYGVDNSRGLSDVLSGRLEIEDVIQNNSDTGVDIIPAGSAAPNAAELIASERMVETINRLKEHYNMVLIDSPALTVVADATQIASVVDNVLVIVTRRRSTRDGVRRAMDQLQQIGANVVGVVINNAEKKSMQSYYHAIARTTVTDNSQGGGRSGKGAAMSPELPKPASDDEPLPGGATPA